MSARMPKPPVPPGRPLADNTPTGTIVDDEGRVRRVIQAGPSELPPPGDARRDELKKRDDDLNMRLKAIEEALGLDNSAGPTVDVARIPIENEIASKFDYLKVSEAQPEYAYYWANVASQYGLDVTAHQVMGYEIVCGSMPEAMNCKDELGRRKIGDVILMRIKLDEYLKLRQLDRQKRQMREDGVTATLQAMSDRWGRRGVRLHQELNEYQMGRLARKAQAQQIARQQFDDMLRTGRVQGMQAR